MYVQRDDHATGLIRLLSIALRVLTLMEFGVRRQLAAEGATLAGLYAGNAKRETARPTAERLLEAFQEVTLMVVGGGPPSLSPSDGSEPLTRADSGAVRLLLAGVYQALHCFSRTALKMGETGALSS